MASVNTHLTSATTNPKVVEACYTWTIHNISFLLKDTEQITSTFFKPIDEETPWKWYCYIKQVNGDINFGLVVYGSNIPRIPAEFKFSLLGPKGELALSEPNFRIFDSNTKQHTCSSMSKTKILEHKTDPGDTLTVICRVRAKLSQASTVDNFPIPPCQMQHVLETILKDALFTDVTLVVEERVIKAHKNILSAHSPVFAAMFSSDMVESRQSQVTVPDMEYEVAQQLLRYIYTGNAEIKPNMADSLLAAADKYGLMRLKAQCEQAISKTIAVPTAIKTLIFADRMNAENLKSYTMKFVKANMNQVMESDDWKSMVVEHPTLLCEVCRKLADK